MIKSNVFLHSKQEIEMKKKVKGFILEIIIICQVIFVENIWKIILDDITCFCSQVNKITNGKLKRFETSFNNYYKYMIYNIRDVLAGFIQLISKVKCTQTINIFC